MKEMVGGCCVCSDERGWTENPLVYCDGPGCNVAVHQACYGIVQVPTGPWFCRKCECSSGSSKQRVRCELCPSRDGALKPTDNGGWAHVVCALYIPEVRFGNVTSMEPIVLQLVPPERYNKTCFLCEEKFKDSKRVTMGACMQCNKAGCRQYFHVTCAQTAGLLCEEAGNYNDNVKYCGYCPHHYQKLKKDAHIKIIPAFKPVPSAAGDTIDDDVEIISASVRIKEEQMRDDNNSNNNGGNNNSSDENGEGGAAIATASSNNKRPGRKRAGTSSSGSGGRKRQRSGLVASSSDEDVKGSDSEIETRTVRPKRASPAKRGRKSNANGLLDSADEEDPEDKEIVTKSSGKFTAANFTDAGTAQSGHPVFGRKRNNAKSAARSSGGNTPNTAGSSGLNDPTPNFSSMYDNLVSSSGKSSSTSKSGGKTSATPPSSSNFGASPGSGKRTTAPPRTTATSSTNENPPSGPPSPVIVAPARKRHKQNLTTTPASSTSASSGAAGGSASASENRTTAATVANTNGSGITNGSGSASKNLEGSLYGQQNGDGNGGGGSSAHAQPTTGSTTGTGSSSDRASALFDEIGRSSSHSQPQPQQPPLSSSSLPHAINDTSSGGGRAADETPPIVGAELHHQQPQPPPLLAAASSPPIATSRTPLIPPPRPGTVTQPPPPPLTFPTSLEQLLERQWDQGSAFLMKQSQHFDIAALLSCLHQLKTENQQLEEKLNHLTSRRDHLLAVNARLGIPLGSAHITTMAPPDDTNAPPSSAVVAPTHSSSSQSASSLSLPAAGTNTNQLPGPLPAHTRTSSYGPPSTAGGVNKDTIGGGGPQQPPVSPVIGSAPASLPATSTTSSALPVTSHPPPPGRGSTSGVRENGVSSPLEVCGAPTTSVTTTSSSSTRSSGLNVNNHGGGAAGLVSAPITSLYACSPSESIAAQMAANGRLPLSFNPLLLGHQGGGGGPLAHAGHHHAAKSKGAVDHRSAGSR